MVTDTLDVNKITEPLQNIQILSLELQGKCDIEKSLIWMTEELGEVISAIRKKHDKEDISGEIGDLFAWIICLCNILDIDLRDSINKTYLKELSRQYSAYGKLKYSHKRILFDGKIYK